MTQADDDARDTEAPPHDRHAEEAVLGAVIKRPIVIATLTHLEPRDFYTPRYRTIWKAMRDLWDRNIAIDFITLGERLASADYAEARIGLAELATINLSVPSAANVLHYAAIVTDTATQRRYVSAAQSIAEKAYRRGANVHELAEQAEALLVGARSTRSRGGLLDPEQWAEAFWQDLEQRMDGKRTAVMTGLVDLDGMTLGLEAGGLYLLMATPGTGKTEFGMQIGMHASKKHGPVLFASLEMSAVELAHRYARISRGLDRNRLASGKLESDEMATVAEVMNAMLRDRFWPASPKGNYTTADLRADAFEVQAKAGHLALIVADYVQRFRDKAGRQSSREQDIGLVAENLKSLAREFNCPVLAPVQPNRDYVARGNKRPVLSDLRESGKLEQEADVVLGLYRDEKHHDDTRDRAIAELHMLKNRSGVGDSWGMRKFLWLENRYVDFVKDVQSRYAA